MVYELRKRLLAVLISVSFIISFTGFDCSTVEAAPSSGNNLGPILISDGMAQPVLNVTDPYEGYSYQELTYIWFTHYLLGVDNQVDILPDILWQNNLTGEYQKVEKWDTGENIRITPGITNEKTVSANNSFTTHRDIYDNILIGTDTPSSVCWSYDIKEPTTINGKIPVHLKVKTDFTGDYDLPMTLYLVDYCEKPFEAYAPRFESEIDFGNSNENNEDSEQVKHKKTTNRKMITRGIINLCNPNADYEPATATRPEEPIKTGEYYDYTVYLQPNYYTFQQDTSWNSISLLLGIRPGMKKIRQGRSKIILNGLLIILLPLITGPAIANCR